ncbi:hypothetical protein Hanom_Chr04g00370061 [Helianthus anomalus]
MEISQSLLMYGGNLLGSVLDEGDEATKRFTYFLGKPSRLVRYNEAEVHINRHLTLFVCTKYEAKVAKNEQQPFL